MRVLADRPFVRVTRRRISTIRELLVTRDMAWSIYLLPFLLTYQAVLDTIAPTGRRDGVAPWGAVEAGAFMLPERAVASLVGW